MKRRQILLFILLIFIGYSLRAQETKHRPKIGLVLSGGGAKGFAHVGVLKVLEEAGIPIDYVAGTSIGSIVGGFYAMGYDADTLEKIVKSQDWATLLSDQVDRRYIPVFDKHELDRYNLSFPIRSKRISLPSGALNGQNVQDLFSYLALDYQNVTDFSKLPRSFLCVAADIETGKEVVLKHGYLPLAIRASMSVPTAFSAADVDGRLLVDGGIINNFPVDRCKEMGADIIIGVDIQYGLRDRKELQSIPDVVNQMINLMSYQKSKENRKLVDYYIKPDISGFSASSFDAASADELIKRGEAAARKVLPQLIKLRDSLHLKPNPIKPEAIPNLDRKLIIERVTVDGAKSQGLNYFLGLLDLEPPQVMTVRQLREGIKRIYGSGNFDFVRYRLLGDENKTLHLTVKERIHDRLNLGIHYDTDRKAALLINTTFKNSRKTGAKLSMDAILATNPAFAVRYTIDNGWKPGLFVGASIHDETISQYTNGDKSSLVNLQLYKGQLATHSVYFDAFRISLGAEVEHFNVESVIGSIPSDIDLNNQTLLNYYAQIDLDQMNRAYFPTVGWKFLGEAKIVTDNGWLFNESNPFMPVKLSIQLAKSFGSRFTILPSVKGRIIVGSGEPIYYKTFVGGVEQTDYLNAQVPFIGLRRMEMMTRNVAVGEMDFRFRFWENIYLTLNTNLGFYGDDNDFLSKGDVLAGGGVTASYDSMVGPVELMISSSNISKEPSVFLSLGYWF
ncbi:patatin [Prolixibacter bellariivorans]|uniref:Patatin n=1 Tax=Prolixibacter bellariivorans TaxID=314319 RepID=A0A5M4AV77_9BACT|nr:patatin-like phospholipase family protein [Prolixibacter bellariivorans]GET31842.1 patatin [Prolixibacter bellariivorans]